MEKLIENIINNVDIRKSLIELKRQSHDHKEFLSNQKLYNTLVSYLNHEDPKVRKNAALIIGMFQYDDVVETLLIGYNRETTEFVKEAYLKGCLNHDCSHYVKQLEDIQSKLMNNQDIEHTKHIQSQLKVINLLVQNNQKYKQKQLQVQHPYVDVVLTTVPWYQYTLFEDLKGLMYKPVGQGVLVRSSSLLDLKNLRNYEEMLIPLRGCSGNDINSETIIHNIIKSNLEDILNNIYTTDEPFYFKIDDRLRVKNGKLMKQVADGLSLAYPKLLLNSPHMFEIEIVLKELRPNKVNAYLKLMDIENRRFTYRREASAFSIKPFLAATLMKLAQPYLIDHSRVLDPFCGSGTLLIERDKIKHTRFIIGVDIFAQALDQAKKNAGHANVNIHFVHKDALRFVNSEDFDEIFTDMPTREQMNDSASLTDLYDRFFKRIPRLVRHDGYVFIYTSELSLVRKNLRLQQNSLSLVEHYELIRERKMYYFFIIKVK